MGFEKRMVWLPEKTEYFFRTGPETHNTDAVAVYFQMACKLRMFVSSIFNNKSKELQYFSTHENLWNSNLDYWNTATLTYFHTIYGCFHATLAGLGSCDRDHKAHKAENIYSLALHSKSLLTHGSARTALLYYMYSSQYACYSHF